MGGNVLAEIIGDPPQIPAWLNRASKHARGIDFHRFWMMHLQNNRDEIVRLAALVYVDDLYQQKPADVNQVAALWARTRHATRRWVDMFTVPQWLELQDELVDNGKKGTADYLADFADIGALRPARRKSRNSRAVEADASYRDMGAWLLHHRELVVRLLDHEYAAGVIAAMYTEELEHREIIACTWFRGTDVVNDNAVLIGFKTAPDVHGFVFANPTHLAERHLYRHFDFEHEPRFDGDDAIKAQNSFFPRGTTQLQLAGLHDRGGFYVGPNDGLVQVVNQGTTYSVYIRRTEPANVQTRRVVSLYPQLAQDHRDYFTRDKLERIKAVAAQFGNSYASDKPELEWIDPPRGRR